MSHAIVKNTTTKNIPKNNEAPIGLDPLATVECSPAAVAIHDKAAWMSIFAEVHAVEDPVGSSPHYGGLFDAVSGIRGHGALSRFYDTFIAPNQISFDVKKDVVCHDHVVRDLTINLTMADGISAEVPMHLLYELVQENSEWRIKRLAAHWELVPMVMQLLAKGLPALPVLTQLSVRMFKNQGVLGMLAFSKAAFNVGDMGKSLVKNFANAKSECNPKKGYALFDEQAEGIHLPYGQGVIDSETFFVQQNKEYAFSKIIAAGDTVSTSVLVINKDETGKVVGQDRGVALFEINKKTKTIHRVKFYL